MRGHTVRWYYWRWDYVILQDLRLWGMRPYRYICFRIVCCFQLQSSPLSFARQLSIWRQKPPETYRYCVSVGTSPYPRRQKPSSARCWYPLRSTPGHETWSLGPGILSKRVLWMTQVNASLRKDKYVKTMLWNWRDRGRIYATMPEFSLEVSGETQKFL